MLIDYGADCSLISFKTGQALGLQILETDDIEEAFGIGGRIEYVRKQNRVQKSRLDDSVQEEGNGVV